MSEGVRVINTLSESHLTRIWQHQLLDKTGLVTEEGEPIEIIYPGRINGDRGADFRDAVIATSRGLIKGDIELHIRSSSWQEHRHHRDAVYNRVILHVVMWHNARVMTKLENGKEVPVLALHKYVPSPAGRRFNRVNLPDPPNMPCLGIGQRATADTLTRFLDSAGEARFLAKASRFQADLGQVEAGQSLYQGIMGALGYTKNKLPFLELARRLPLPVLESIAREKKSDEECLSHQQALLLGTAGLLPSLCPCGSPGDSPNDLWVDRLERIWASCHRRPVMTPGAWHLFKVRPNNSPLRRLAAMSYLILRYRQEGILEAVVSMIKEAPGDRGYRRLEEGLLVTTDGYWANHFDFGSGGRLRTAALLGQGQAASIIVNVLLPFTFAWSQLTARSGLASKALDLYQGYPGLPVNTVERHMAEQLGLSRSLVNSAQRQQGLIHIYQSLCAQGRCNDCLLSQLEAGNHIQI